MICEYQFRDLITETLKEYGLFSESAVNLLLGTAAQESLFGKYIRQVRGPALGVFQMEPETFKWMRDKYGERFGFQDREAEDMVWDMKLAILLARLRYFVVPEALPPADDILGTAKYWKKYYNTIHGAGTTEQFVHNYKKFVA